MDSVKNIRGKSPGRRPGGADTRAHIIAAAQECFATAGYDRTTLRQIGIGAGVDPALIMHYFGTKQTLFVEAMLPLFEGPKLLPAVLEGDQKGTGLRLARLFVSLISEPSTQMLLLGLFRSASSENAAAALLRSFIQEKVITLVEPHLPGPDKKLQANIVGGQLIGVFIARYIVKAEPIASATERQLAAYLAPILQAHFTGDRWRRD